jgi:hypothetical protein
MPGSQSNAGVHRPLSLGDDKGSSAAASDRCLRANVGVFVLKAYICALNLRSCCLHPMDAGDGESTQKMRGRCKTLGHHDTAAAQLEPIRRTRKPRKRCRVTPSGGTLISFPGVRSVSRRCPRRGRDSSHLLAMYSIEYEPLQLPKCLKESLCRRLPMSKVTHLVQVPSSGLRSEL